MRVAYVVHGEILAPVVRSQTFPLLAELRRRGHETRLVVVASPRRLLDPGRWREALKAAAEAAGEAPQVISHLPRHAFPGLVTGRLRRALRRIAPDVVHARQSRAAVPAARAGVAPVLLDLRGLRPDEFLLARGGAETTLGRRERRALSRLRAEDREALERAAAVVCVSEPFRRRLGAGDRVLTIPNAAAPLDPPGPVERERLRGDFGLGPGDIAFVYSGSLAPWQCAAEAVRLFAAVRKERPEARLVLLTHDELTGRALADAEGASDAVVRAFTPEETRRMLPAFDVALLLRERNVVNEVASPVKFAEYLHAGLPVVLTEGIGDATCQVADHGLGLVLSGPREPRNAERVVLALAEFDGERSRRFARERLTFEVTAPRYIAAYERGLRAGGERL